MTAGRGSALVTGAASGIGLEVATRLRRRGYQVLAVDRDATRLAAAVDRIVVGAGPGTSTDTRAILALDCDLADPAQLEQLTNELTTTWRDSLEVVVANAGVIAPGNLVDVDPAAIDLQLDVMLRSVMHLTRAVLPQFLEHDRGHILATVSMGGILALPTSATYSAAKAGLRAFLAAINAEVYSTGVHVSGIYPSAVDTPMLLHEATSGGSALNFFGAVQSVDDVADAYDRALERPRLEHYVPYSDSLITRLLNTFPALTPKLLPVANRIGERGRQRYLTAKR